MEQQELERLLRALRRRLTDEQVTELCDQFTPGELAQWFPSSSHKEGSHVHLIHITKPGKVTVPNPKKDFKPRTLRYIFKQAGLNP